MKKSFLEAVKSRRTCYSITKESPLTDDKITEIITEAVKHTPSAFNSQSSRVVVLFGKQHDRLWEIVKDELRKIVPADKFGATENKVNNTFKCGYASVLFFEDMNVIKGLQEQFPSYKDAFPMFSDHSAGMLQHVVWTALSDEGLGASLQHYNPVIDNAVKSEWKLPESWRLIAQMPFGKPSAPAGDKEFMPISERLKIFK